MVPEISTSPVKVDPGAKVLDDKSKLRLQKAVKDFESIFVNYLLQNMRKTVQKPEEGENEFGGDMMQSMFDLEIAKHISQQGNIGIGAMLYKQLTGEALPRISVIPASTAVSVPDQLSVAPSPSLPAPAGMPSRLYQYDDIIRQASGDFDLNPNLIKAVMAAESAGDPRAISSKKAKGLMQLIDSTATEMGVNDVWDPQENITGGAKYLKQLIKRFDGDATLAVASYNAGPNAVEKHGGVPPYAETQQYVKRVMNYFRLFEQQGALRDEDN